MFITRSSLLRLSIFSIVVVLSSILLSCSKGSVIEKESSSPAPYAYKPPTPQPTPVDNKVNQYDLPLLDGGSTKVSELIGNKKVVLVNFWATWCGPCRREIPELVALQREFKSKGVEIVGLTVEPEGERDAVRDFTQKFSINYKIGFSPKEMFFIFNGTDPRGPIPQTFIFDRNGKLVDSVKGLRRDFRQWVEGAINHALNNS